MTQRILIIGAGATGRGHLGALCFEAGFDLTFVDRDKALVSALAKAGSYTVALCGDAERELVVDRFRAVDVADTEAVAQEFDEAALVLTAVLPENLSAIAPVVAGGVRRCIEVRPDVPTNVVACENMQCGSSALRKRVDEHLSTDETERARACVGFPDAMISRIVPLPKDDPLRIVAEDYNEWVARRTHFLGPKPALDALELVDNLEARLERKLFMHNGAHAVCAYLAFEKGHRYIHEAVADASIARVVVGALEEIGEVVRRKHGFSQEAIDAYRESFVKRGAIPQMADQVARVVRDPIRKLASDERLVAPAFLAHEFGLPRKSIVAGIAAALAYRCDDDPQSLRIAGLLRERTPALAFAEISGIDECDTLCLEVADALHEMNSQRGVST